MKMKLLVFFIGLILFDELNGQSITLKLFISNPCFDSVGVLDFYTLEKHGNRYYPAHNDGIVNLPEQGVYKLSLTYFDDVLDYEVLGGEIIIDTIRMYSIRQCLEPISHPNFVGYCCCDEKCEGKQVDYYQNGFKRIEGYFKEGKPIGELIFYYPDGEIKEVHRYSKKSKLLGKSKQKARMSIKNLSGTYQNVCVLYDRLPEVVLTLNGNNTFSYKFPYVEDEIECTWSINKDSLVLKSDCF